MREQKLFICLIQNLIGAELTDFVLVLNTKEAVKTFSHGGNVTLGGNVSGIVCNAESVREKVD